MGVHVETDYDNKGMAKLFLKSQSDSNRRRSAVRGRSFFGCPDWRIGNGVTARIAGLMLALAVGAKSLHCAAVESQFQVVAGGLAAAASADTPSLPPPISNFPLPAEEGCDTGCLCQGYVAAPAVDVPQPELGLAGELATRNIATESELAAWHARIGWLWHLHDFPDRHLSGRAQRHWFRSLTI